MRLFIFSYFFLSSNLKIRWDIKFNVEIKKKKKIYSDKLLHLFLLFSAPAPPPLPCHCLFLTWRHHVHNKSSFYFIFLVHLILSEEHWKQHSISVELFILNCCEKCLLSGEQTTTEKLSYVRNESCKVGFNQKAEKTKLIQWRSSKEPNTDIK